MSLIKAAGRFRFLLFWTAVVATLFLIAVGVAATIGDESAVAAAVMFHNGLMGPVGTYLAMRPLGGRARDLAAIYVLPFMASTTALTVPSLAFAYLLSDMYSSHVATLIGVSVVAAGIYLLLMSQMQPTIVKGIGSEVRRIIRRDRLKPRSV